MKRFSTMIRILTIGVLVVFSGATAAQDYPIKPIRIILPQAPGGSSTALARLIGQKLTENWGQPVIVDNRPGGNGLIATQALLKSPPDGYTARYVTTAEATLPSLVPKLPYDTIKDFAPVATLVTGVYVLVLHPSLPVKSVKELIALAKAKPGQLNFGSSGNGQGAHLAAEQLKILAGIKMQHIPYKGTGPAMIDLLAGRIALMFTTPFNAVSRVKSGRLKALAVGSETRVSAMPQVPTFTESGLPGMDVNVWHGIVMPGGTPKAIIEKLSAEIGRILTTPDVKKFLEAQGFEPFISTPDQFVALFKADMIKYAKIVETANIRIE